jgi:hypothetical protein
MGCADRLDAERAGTLSQRAAALTARRGGADATASPPSRSYPIAIRVEVGINKVHTCGRGKEAAMPIVKTAISLPGPLFERADALARQQKISRSQLFARAVEEFLRRHESQALLESLNRVYEDCSPTPEEKEVRRLMKQKQREMVKGEW